MNPVAMPRRKQVPLIRCGYKAAWLPAKSGMARIWSSLLVFQETVGSWGSVAFPIPIAPGGRTSWIAFACKVVTLITGPVAQKRIEMSFEDQVEPAGGSADPQVAHIGGRPQHIAANDR